MSPGIGKGRAVLYPAAPVVTASSSEISPGDTDRELRRLEVALRSARLDLEPDSLRPRMVVADVIPNPPRTALLEDAEARGATVLDGLGMLVNQGVISIRHWTGVEADATVMRRKVEELFGLLDPPG